MIRRFSYIAIAILVLTILLAQIAFAGAQTYVDKQHVINAGVLLPRKDSGINKDAVAAPMAPYIFYIMGLRDDLKPHGWTFVNPLAGGNAAYKNYAGYWEVSLGNTTYENLAKFDVLYMSADEAVRFPMDDRDKLRRYVDGGGCLWVDNGGNMKFPSGADEFFLPGINFVSGGGGTPMLLQSLHPLVTTPYRLNPLELASLSSTSKAINPGYESSWGPSIPSPTTLSPILVSTSGSGISSDPPTIAAIEYGSGRVVFTSGFIGGNIQNPIINGASPIPDHLDLNSSNINIMAASPANVRFAYNVVGYATSYTTFRKEYRRTGYSVETLGAPLLKQWRCSQAISRGDIENSPVIWKGIIFYSSGNTLYAMDANPGNDIDMNGVADDGVPDGANADCDVIWSHNCPDEISSPTVVTMLDPSADPLEPRDFVLVTCRDGHVYVFSALSSNLASDTLRDDLWTGSIGDGDGALLPPVVQNGWIYVAGRDGKIYAYSPMLKEAASKSMFNQSSDWSLPLNMNSANPVKVKSGPTLAFVKNQTNGAVVQMLSVIGRPPKVMSPSPNDYIYSLPVFVSSDKLSPISPAMLRYNPTSAKFRTSYGMLPISSYPAPEAWAVDGAGNSIPLDTPDISSTVGQVTIRTTSGVLGPNVKVYMSYAIDYSKVTNFIPPNYELPPNMGDVLTQQLEAASTPAISSNDTFYMGVDWGDTPGSGRSSIYSMWFDGTSRSAKLGFNYFLHGAGSFINPAADSSTAGGMMSLLDATRNSMTGVPDRFWGVQASLPDPTDPQKEIIYPVANLEAKCTPAVTNDRVFVTATTHDPGNSAMSRGYLLCLKAGQEFTIRLNRSLKDPSVPDRKYDVSVWQPDFLFADGASTLTPANAATRVPSDMIDYDSGTITVSNFSRIRLQGLTVGGVQIQTNMLSTSLPVWVFVDHQLIPLDQVDFSSWDNLLWSMAVPDHDGVPCSGVSSSPIVLGDYVYFTCDDGYIFAVPVDATPEDSKTKIVDAGKIAEMKQRIDPDINTMTGSFRSSLAGGNGMLVVPSPCGIYLFKNELSLLTDNHRLLEVGTDGKVSWSCDSVSEYAPLSGSGTGTIYGATSQPLNKPLVAQKYNGSDYLVVDSGNDRILRIDRGGQIAWSCTVFDDSFRSLLRSGEPKKLESPSDAIMWSEFEKIDGNWYYLNHCMVADSGNFRILDIVDRYYANASRQILGPVKTDSNGRPIHQLNWISRTTDRDKRFTYNSVKLISGVDKSSGSNIYINQVWASLSNYGLGTANDLVKTESTGGGQLGGAIVAMKYREGAGDFQWTYDDNSVIVSQLTTLTASNGSKVALSGPTYFDALDSTLPRLLICDSSAVYVVEGSDGKIIWDLTAKEYAALSRKITKVNTVNGEESTLDNVVVPVPFMPYRAQMLPNNRILIVNSYAGQIGDLFRSKFNGEVFEVDYHRDSSPNYIEWYTPDIWRNDPTADNSDLGPYTQKMKNSSNLEQPTCVQRLF